MGVNLRKLAPEEVERYFARGSGVNISEYIEALRGLRPGDYAEAVRHNVSSRAFKRRLTLAAKHLGLALRYAREAGEEAIRFEVREQPASAAGGATVKRGRGRPRKITT